MPPPVAPPKPASVGLAVLEQADIPASAAPAAKTAARFSLGRGSAASARGARDGCGVAQKGQTTSATRT
jgi:hypothetical protein